MNSIAGNRIRSSIIDYRTIFFKIASSFLDKLTGACLRMVSVLCSLRKLKKGASPMREKVQEALNKVRPTLQKDGGDVVLIEVTNDGVVKVQLTGACRGCPMSQVTLKEGIEKFLKSEVPEIAAVEAV
jgi:Fe-S cluster biogenesis protein NfuA